MRSLLLLICSLGLFVAIGCDKTPKGDPKFEKVDAPADVAPVQPGRLQQAPEK